MKKGIIALLVVLLIIGLGFFITNKRTNDIKASNTQAYNDTNTKVTNCAKDTVTSLKILNVQTELTNCINTYFNDLKQVDYNNSNLTQQEKNYIKQVNDITAKVSDIRTFYSDNKDKVSELLNQFSKITGFDIEQLNRFNTVSE